MYSLIHITVYLIISLILLGLTTSISATHYKWVQRYKNWGYMIFPLSMIIWGILIYNEAPELAISVVGIWYVGIYAMFRHNKFVQVNHYLGVILAVINLAIVVNNWEVLFKLSVLIIISMISTYRLYISEIVIIIYLYLYLFNII